MKNKCIVCKEVEIDETQEVCARCLKHYVAKRYYEPPQDHKHVHDWKPAIVEIHVLSTGQTRQKTCYVCQLCDKIGANLL